MARQIGSAFIDIKGKSSEFRRGMERNAQKVNKFGRNVRKSDAQLKKFNATANKTGAALKGIVAGFAGVAGFSMLRDRIKEISDFAAAVYESSIRLGVNTETFQAWRRAFEGESGSIEGADKALEKFTRAVGESRSEIRKGTFDTGSYSEVFKQLGITAEQVQNQDLVGLLGLTAKGMKGLSDQTDVAAYGLELFGARGKSAINVLMDGQDEFIAKLEYFKSLGTLTLFESEELKKVSQAFTDVGTVFQNIFAKIVVKYSDQIRAALARTIERAHRMHEAFKTFVSFWPQIRSVGVAIATLFGAKLAVGAALTAAAVIKAVGALKLLRIALIKTGIGALVVGLGTAIYYFDQLIQKTGGFKNAMFTVWEAIKQTFEKATNVVKAYQKLKEGVWLKITEYITRGMAKGLEAVFDFVNDTRRVLAGLMGGAARLFKDWKQVLKGAVTFSGSEIAEIYRKGYEEAAAAVVEVGSETMETMTEKVEEFAERAGDAFKGAKELLEEVKEGYKFTHIASSYGPRRGSRAGQAKGVVGRDPTVAGTGGAADYTTTATPDAPVYAPTKSVEPEIYSRYAKLAENVKELNRGIADGFSEIGRSTMSLVREGEFQLHNLRDTGLKVAEDVAAKFADRVIWEPFANMINDLLTKLTDAVGKMLAAAGDSGGSGHHGRSGDFWSNLGSSIFGRARGGGVTAGQPYMTGEEGRELFVPKSDGHIYNARQTRNMLGGNTVNFAPTINSNDPEAVEAKLRGMMPEFAQFAKEQITYDRSRPGKVASAFGG